MGYSSKEIYVGIDESGITNRHKRNIKDALEYKNIENNFFSTTAIVFKKEEYDNYLKEYDFKMKSFIKEPIHFSKIKNDYFVYYWLNFLKNKKFKIYHSLINKNSFYNKYKLNSYDPYMLSLKYIIERIIKDYRYYKINLVIENRSWESDLSLFSFLYKEILKNNWFKNIKDIKIIKKNNNNSYKIIEISDTISYLLMLIFEKKELKHKDYFIKYIENYVIKKFQHFPNILGYSFKLIE